MLEIGKYYQQRNGVVVGPLQEYHGRMAAEGFKFCAEAEGVSNRVWRYDGSFLLDRSKQSNCDIVSGVQFTPLQDLSVQLTQQPKEEIVSKEFKIEVGKYYRDRDGDVHGPMLSNDNEDYPFGDQDGSYYTMSGKYVEGRVSDIDLIEEIPNPYEIKPEEIVKITDADNRPTIEEVLSAIQRGDDVTAIDSNWGHYSIKHNSYIQKLLDAKSFEIKVKQPVVKYKYVYQAKNSPNIYISDYHFADIDEFLDEDSKDDFEFFEPIQATRKEF